MSRFLYLRLRRRVSELESAVEDLEEAIERLEAKTRELTEYQALVVQR